MVECPAPGMRCMFCSYRLKATIRKVDPGLEMRVDLQAGRCGWAAAEIKRAGAIV